MGVNYVPWITAVIILISKIRLIQNSLIVERTVPGTFVTLGILTSQRKSSQKLIILLKIFLKYILMSTVDKHARSIYDFRLSGFPDTLLFRPVYFP